MAIFETRADASIATCRAALTRWYRSRTAASRQGRATAAGASPAALPGQTGPRRRHDRPAIDDHTGRPAGKCGGELRKFGIKVGTICPGGVKTEFAVGKGRTEEGVKASYMMEPCEIADAIVFACMQPRNARILQMTVRHMGEPGR